MSASVLYDTAVETITVTTTQTLTQTIASTPDWIIAIAAVASVVVAVFLAWYAKKTEEAKKDRRKDTIEKELENVYSPLEYILQRANVATMTEDDKQKVQRIFPNVLGIVETHSDFVIEDRDWKQMREIVTRFGHYLDPEIQDQLTKVVEKRHQKGYGERALLAPTPPHYRIADDDGRPILNNISKRRVELIDELKELTKKA